MPKRKVSKKTLDALAKGRAKRLRNLNSKKGGVSKVVKRKRRSSPKKSVRRRSKAKHSQKVDVLMDVGFPALYGYGRDKLSDVLEPVTSHIPAGAVGDEVLIGVGAYLGNKYSKNSKIKKLCKNALVIEASRVGETVSDLGFKKTFTGK